MVTLKKRVSGFTIVEVLIVLAIVGVMLAGVMLATTQIRESQRRNQANKELNTIVEAAILARQYKSNRLQIVTGSGCSRCICPAPPATVDSSPACISGWNTALTRISASGLDISNLDKDPWGSPYLLDENEGESGPSDCRLDSIRSAGPDGVYPTSDDLYRTIPLRRKPCP